MSKSCFHFAVRSGPEQDLAFGLPAPGPPPNWLPAKAPACSSAGKLDPATGGIGAHLFFTR
jgi:hypothetical protein